MHGLIVGASSLQLDPLLAKRIPLEPVLSALRPGCLPGQDHFDLLWTELFSRQGAFPDVVVKLRSELNDPAVLELARAKYLEAYAAGLVATRASWELQREPRPTQVWPACSPKVQHVVQNFTRSLIRWLEEGGEARLANVPTPKWLLGKNASKLVGTLKKGLLSIVDDDVGWAGKDRTTVERTAASALRRKAKSVSVSVRTHRAGRAASGLPQAVVHRGRHGLSQKKLRRTILFAALRALHPPAVDDAARVFAGVKRAALLKIPTLKQRTKNVSRQDLDALVPATLEQAVAAIVPTPHRRAASTREVLVGICLALHLDTPWDSTQFTALGLPSGKTVLETVRRWQETGVWTGVSRAFEASGLRLNQARIAQRRPKRTRARRNR